VERHGLIVLIALGESIAAVGVGVAGPGLQADRVVTAVLGLALPAALWWLYFDGEDEQACAGMYGPERGAVMTMRYKLLGRTGLRVSELCLGAMIFGDDRGGWGTTKDEAARIVERFAQAGGNLVDTANYYARGQSERIVGELIKPERERWVLSTKYTLTMRPDDPNGGGAHRKSLVQSLEASLRRLGTDYVDLYWVHIWDAFTPVEEVVRALDDAVSAGKVLYVGISDTPAWIVAQAVTLADLRGWTRFAGLQVPYSLVERSVERELLPMAPRPGCDRLGARAAGTRRDRADPRRAPPQAAEDNLGALEVELTAEELARLEEVSRIELGFPYDFGASRLAYGDTRPLIDDHRRTTARS
jgi:aryl-alcohol dehydrogenase-like predicted oxidoreductase